MVSGLGGRLGPMDVDVGIDVDIDRNGSIAESVVPLGDRICNGRFDDDKQERSARRFHPPIEGGHDTNDQDLRSRELDEWNNRQSTPVLRPSLLERMQFPRILTNDKEEPGLRLLKRLDLDWSVDPTLHEDELELDVRGRKLSGGFFPGILCFV